MSLAFAALLEEPRQRGDGPTSWSNHQTEAKLMKTADDRLTRHAVSWSFRRSPRRAREAESAPAVALSVPTRSEAGSKEIRPNAIEKLRISLRMVGPPFDLPPCLNTFHLRLSRI